MQLMEKKDELILKAFFWRRGEKTKVVMKIDQSICNDWTLSPLINCLIACGLKIKIASEQSVSVSLCAGVFVCIYSSFCLYVFAHASTGVFFLCYVPVLALSYMGTVCFLPITPKVFINLDSRRQIARPQAATHPSLQGLPKAVFNMHFSFPCCC